MEQVRVASPWKGLAPAAGRWWLNDHNDDGDGDVLYINNASLILILMVMSLIGLLIGYVQHY